MKPRRWLRASFLQITSAIFALASVGHTASKADPQEHVAVQLIAEQTSVQAGTRTWLGIQLRHDAHWHTYWVNPGDSGLPTRVEWRLSPGYRAHDIHWPVPKRFIVGELNNFGYDGTVVLPVALDIPSDAAGVAEIAAQIKWVVCSAELCLPGKSDVQLRLPVGRASLNPQTTALFAAARARVPVRAAWAVSLQERGERLRIEVRDPKLPAGANLDVFPTVPNLISNASPKIAWHADRWMIETERSAYFTAKPPMLSLVIVHQGFERQLVQAWQIDVPWPAS